MAEELVDDAINDNLGSLCAQIDGARGGLVVPEWSDHEYLDYQAVIEHLQSALDTDRVVLELRMVLGRACTTAAKAIDQFVVALQLPYEAARGWADFLHAITDRFVGLRQCVVVTEAAGLLRHEDDDLWSALVDSLCSGPPRCLRNGWRTLVLLDYPHGWSGSRFRSAAATQAAGSRWRTR